MKNVGSDVKKDIKATKEKEYKKYINFGRLQLKEPTLLSNEDNFINEMKKSLEKNLQLELNIFLIKYMTLKPKVWLLEMKNFHLKK